MNEQQANGANHQAAEEGAHISPEMMAQIRALRTQVQLTVGQVVLSMMNLPRYRFLNLGDLTQFVLDPLLRDKMSVARKRRDDQPESEEGDVVGIVLWASVSDAVDKKLTDQVKAGVFPVRLSNEDWASGETIWLLDVIASDQAQATSVLRNFSQIAGDKPIKIHPFVTRLVEPGLLEKMRVQQPQSAASKRT